MIEIQPDRIETVYLKFCETLDLKQASWRSIFEFAAFVGGQLLDVREPECIEYPDNVYGKIEMLHSPNSDTLLKAYKIRRYSFWGRVKTPITMANHALKYVGYSVVGAYRQWKRTWL